MAAKSADAWCLTLGSELVMNCAIFWTRSSSEHSFAAVPGHLQQQLIPINAREATSCISCCLTRSSSSVGFARPSILKRSNRAASSSSLASGAFALSPPPTRFIADENTSRLSYSVVIFSASETDKATKSSNAPATICFGRTASSCRRYRTLISSSSSSSSSSFPSSLS